MAIKELIKSTCHIGGDSKFSLLYDDQTLEVIRLEVAHDSTRKVEVKITMDGDEKGKRSRTSKGNQNFSNLVQHITLEKVRDPVTGIEKVQVIAGTIIQTTWTVT